LHHSPNEAERREDPGAEYELYADVYFLVLAIRRLLRFHDALAKQLGDPRLDAARLASGASAPDAKVLRDFFEHDEYLLNSPT
jgi:hypothetical protein